MVRNFVSRSLKNFQNEAVSCKGVLYEQPVIYRLYVNMITYIWNHVTFFFLQGDYEIVISDYNRAKALFQNSEVKSFQRGKWL